MAQRVGHTRNGAAQTVPTAGAIVRRADFRSWDDRETLLPDRGNSVAFNEQAKRLETTRDRINKHTGLFKPKSVCGCVSPAFLLWIVNFVAFVVHAGMGTAVLVEGGRNPDKLGFQITQVVGIWTNVTADGYEWSIHDSWLGRWRLDSLCAAFAFISAGFHLLVCSFSFFALAACPCLKVNYVYYIFIERCCLWWRWLEYATSAPIMTIALYLVGGIREQNTILLTLVLQSATMITGLLTEVYSKPLYPDERPTPAQIDSMVSNPKLQAELQQRLKANWIGSYTLRLSAYLLGWWCYVPLWWNFLSTFYDFIEAADKCCNRAPPDWVPVIIWSEVFVFTLFAIPLPIYQWWPPRYYWQTELIYSCLSLISKVLLNGILLSQVFLLGRLDWS